jgi:hypothetical protein
MDARLTRSRLLAVVLTSLLTWPVSAEGLLETDDAVVRANARIDFAEHELAVTRQGFRSPHEGLSLATGRMTPGDRARVAYYAKGVQLARRQLTDLLRKRQAPLQLAAG